MTTIFLVGGFTALGGLSAQLDCDVRVARVGERFRERDSETVGEREGESQTDGRIDSARE